MLGLTYFTPDHIKANKEKIQAFLNEEGASPVVTSGRALEIIERAVPDRNAKFLECAPGTGMLFEMLKKKGYKNFTGADIDNYLHNTEGIDMKVVDVCMSPLPWPDASFDVVLSFETFEHLENPYHVAREMQRVLKPGGFLIVSMPNIQHIFNRIFFFRKGDMPRWRKGNNHIWVYPKGVFTKTFLPYFEIIDKGFYHGFFPWRFLTRFTFWPETEKFGHTAWWVFKKRS